MQEMLMYLAEHEIISSVTTTFVGGKSRIKSVTMHVHDDDGVVAAVTWRSFATEDWPTDWEAFQEKVKSHFFGWWE